MLATDDTIMSDSALLELLAACDALAEATERTNTIAHALAEAHIVGKRPRDVVLNGYVEQADIAARLLERCRGRVAQVRTLGQGSLK